MRVSVIIPAYRFDFIGETLKSVADQTVQPHEVLMFQNKGGISSIAEKINALAAIATGDALIVLCDDDMLAPTFIQDTVLLMEEKKADVVYTDMAKFGMDIGCQSAAEWNGEAFKVSTVPFITSLVRKTAFDSVGGWDPGQEYADYDFYYRLFKSGKSGVHLNHPLFFYRVHHASGSFNMNHEHARALMKAKHPEIL